MSQQQKYYIKLLWVCIGTLVLSFGLSQLPSRFFDNSHFWIPTLFFLLTTIGINKILTEGDADSKEFVFKALAFSMGRLLACMVFVLIYSLIFKHAAVAFTCHFMIQYVIFTVFELNFLLSYIKKPNQ